MDCIVYNLIDSGRGTVCNCVPSSEPIRIQWIVPNPWSQKRPLWDTKQDRVVIMGKRSVKEEVGREVVSNEVAKEQNVLIKKNPANSEET